MKKLIVYFSRTGENYVKGNILTLQKGNTETVAELLAGLTGADRFKIVMAKPYADSYRACVEQVRQDLKENARPELAADFAQLEAYDEIYLGYPSYCGTMPMAVCTFLEKHDWHGKVIHPFCTNEGSGMGNSERDIAKCCPGAVLKKGLSIRGAEAENALPLLQNWTAAD